MGWKTDWLYQCLFLEAKEVWSRAQHEAAQDLTRKHIAPDRLYIQQCNGANWDMPSCKSPVLRAWIYDGIEIKEQFPLGEISFDPGEIRGMFFTQGSMRFHITEDRKRIVLTYLIGPRYGRGYILKPQGQGKRGELVKAGGIEWIS